MAGNSLAYNLPSKGAATTGVSSFKTNLRFDSREQVADGRGNPVSGEWIERFKRKARIQPRLGGETIVAARLEGKEPVFITVRRDPKTITITSDWRAVEVIGGKVYALQPAVDMAQDNRFLTIQGVAGIRP